MDNVNLNKDIDYFLNLDYDQLVKYLLTAPTEEKKLILKNQEIKRKLICPENRHEFSWLAQENSKDIIPYLLDGEDIEILKENEYLIDKMNAVLTSNAIYVDIIVSFKAFQKIIFDNFNIDQVVHMFPVDSFSGYTRGEKATDRVIELLTPKEFTGRSKDYNEVIIAQKNVSKPNNMDDRLPLPKPFAIYCYDEIGPNDIESAKNLGIGIVVVNTKKYNIETNNSQISMFDTMSSGRYNNDLKYANNKSQAVLVESQANRK